MAFKPLDSDEAMRLAYEPLNKATLHEVYAYKYFEVYGKYPGTTENKLEKPQAINRIIWLNKALHRGEKHGYVEEAKATILSEAWDMESDFI